MKIIVHVHISNVKPLYNGELVPVRLSIHPDVPHYAQVIVDFSTVIDNEGYHFCKLPPRNKSETLAPLIPFSQLAA